MNSKRSAIAPNNPWTLQIPGRASEVPSATKPHSTGAPPGADAASVSATVPGTRIRLLCDEELFAMFPGRPAALIGSGDERRFVLLDEVPKPAQTPTVALPPGSL